jgi:hypothetical protein
LCTALCDNHLVDDFFFNVLAYFLISPLVNYNVLVSRGTHRRTELAAENPKNKNKF